MVVLLRSFLWLACWCWAQLGPSVTLHYQGLAHFLNELITSPPCLTLAVWANHTVTGLSHMGPSLCWALVTWVIPNSRAQAPTTTLEKTPRTAILHDIIAIREFTTATNVGATYLEALICHSGDLVDLRMVALGLSIRFFVALWMYLNIYMLVVCLAKKWN